MNNPEPLHVPLSEVLKHLGAEVVKHGDTAILVDPFSSPYAYEEGMSEMLRWGYTMLRVAGVKPPIFSEEQILLANPEYWKVEPGGSRGDAEMNALYRSFILQICGLPPLKEDLDEFEIDSVIPPKMPVAGVIVVPAVFFSSLNNRDVKVRRAFMTRFEIKNVNVPARSIHRSNTKTQVAAIEFVRSERVFDKQKFWISILDAARDDLSSELFSPYADFTRPASLRRQNADIFQSVEGGRWISMFRDETLDVVLSNEMEVNDDTHWTIDYLTFYSLMGDNIKRPSALIRAIPHVLDGEFPLSAVTFRRHVRGVPIKRWEFPTKIVVHLIDSESLLDVRFHDDQKNALNSSGIRLEYVESLGKTHGLALDSTAVHPMEEGYARIISVGMYLSGETQRYIVDTFNENFNMWRIDTMDICLPSYGYCGRRYLPIDKALALISVFVERPS